MKKMNIKLMLTLFAFAVMAFVNNVSAQCNEKVTLQIDPTTCNVRITPADLGAASATDRFRIRKANLTIYAQGNPSANATGLLSGSSHLENAYYIDINWVGVEFEVTNLTTMCVTYVTALDKTGPTATGPAPVSIRCTELVNGKVPAPGTEVFGLVGKIRMPEPADGPQAGRLTNYTTTSGGAAQITFPTDDCSDYTVSYVDSYGTITDCPTAAPFIYQTITRTFTFKDVWGNASAPVVTTINVIKRPITILTPFTFNDCTADISAVGAPFVDWNGNGSSDADEAATSSCGNSASLVSESRMNTCAGSYMVMRQWKLTNCGVTTTVDQVVNVNDRSAPRMNFSFDDFKRVPKLQCRNMGGMRIQEFVYETAREAASTGNLTGTAAVNFFKVTPLMDLNSCLSSRIKLTLAVSDPNCSSYPLTVRSEPSVAGGTSNATVRFAGNMPEMQMTAAGSIEVTGSFSVAAMGDPDPFFYVTTTDACGNITRVKVVVVVIDNLAPNANCSGKEITLTNRGEALVTPDLLSMAEFDNCPLATPIRKYVRRTTPTNDGCWNDNLVVDCNDLGKDIKVDVRIIDMMGNYNDCCVSVKVLDKSGPTCGMVADFSLPCTDTRLAPGTINSLFTTPTAFDNCETITPVSAPVTITLSCGKGDVTKSWTFTDKAGNSATCTQKLTVFNVEGFRVTRLRSEDYTCTPNLEDDKTRILRSIKNLNSAGTVTCSAPVIKITEEMYMSTDFCRRIKRTYQLIDLCKYPTTEPSCTPDFLATDATDLEVQDNNGVVCWTRNITIFDKTPPVAAVIAGRDICVTDNTCASNFPALTLTATDACGATAITPTHLFYRWEVRSGNATTGTLVASGNGTGTGTTNALVVDASSDGTKLQGLALGTYFLTYVVVDDCGNVGQGTAIRVRIQDCKSPYINTHDKNTVLAYVVGPGGLGQGMSMMNVTEVLNEVQDNCTPKATLLSKMKFIKAKDNPTNTYPASATTDIMFTCADLTGTNPVPVQVWTIDNANNAIFNLVYITVEDNNRACTGAQSIVSGALLTETNQPAAKVTLSASMGGTIQNTATTDATGAYSFTVLQGNNYVVKAAKLTTEDKYAGVTTFDIARISKHVLDIEKLTSPYQIIAADVDKSGAVDAADMLHIRNFILRKTATLPAGVWRFVDKSYSFINPADPFGEDFPEVISLTGAKATEAANFVSVKLGDVNNNYTASLAQAVVRNSNSLVLNVADMNLVAGNEYTVNVTADNFNAAAFQGTFAIANATIKSVKAGDLKNYSDANFGLFANELTTSWNGKATGAAQVFSVTFVANKSGKLSEVMTVGSSLTPAMANDVQGNEMTINLKFSTGKVAGGEFALYQNTPNPVANETVIGFNMPKEATAKLTIYSVEGKVVLTKNIDAQAGLNQVSINKNEINASGVLYYRLESADFSATKKMIIIE